METRQTILKPLQGVMLVLVLLWACASLSEASASHRVTVQLRAKWKGTPLLLELGELLAGESNSFFWKFLEKWESSKNSGLNMTDKECVEEMLTYGSLLTGSITSPLLEISLTMRSASPKVVLYRQLARDSLKAVGLVEDEDHKVHEIDVERWEISRNPVAPKGHCCWLDVGGRLLLGEQEVKAWIQDVTNWASEGSGAQIEEFDHVHPGSAVGGMPVILYASPGTPCFHSLHPLLLQAVLQKFVRYAFRPVLADKCEISAESCATVGYGGVVYLAGYGVEMALKNMEYKAIDDSAVKKEEGLDSAKEPDLTQEVKGFIFPTLLERRPDLAADLLNLRDHLLSSAQDAVRDAYSVWELKDLGVQAGQRIVQSSDPLRLMQDISHNFPNLVTSLSRVKVKETILEELDTIQNMVQAGRTLLTINGLLLNLETIDIFSLLDVVEVELKLAARLKKLKLPSKAIRELAKVAPKEGETQVRLDFRSPDIVMFLNNIEQDPLYRSWRSNLNELLMPMYPGQMRAVRKNIFHAVYVIDPTSDAGMKALEEIQYFYRNQVPIRLGVLLVSPRLAEEILSRGGGEGEDPREWEEGDLSDLVIRCFYFIKRTFSTSSAFNFLFKLSENPLASMFESFGLESDTREPLSEASLHAAFFDATREEGAAASSSSLEELKKWDSEEAKFSLASTLHALRLGLGTSFPCMLFNGHYHSAESFGGGTIEAMNHEMQEVQRAIYFHEIHQRTDILQHFLEQGSVKRYNPQILGTDGSSIKYIGLANVLSERGEIISGLQYLHHPGSEDEVKVFSHWLALDLSSSFAGGISLLFHALRHLNSVDGKNARIAILHNSPPPAKCDFVEGTLLISRIVLSLTNVQSRRSKVVPVLIRLLASPQILEANSVCSTESTVSMVLKALWELSEEGGLRIEGLKDTLTNKATVLEALEKLEKEASFVSGELEIARGEDTIISNGRVLLPKENFVAEDFVLLETFEQKKSQPVAEIIEQVDWQSVPSLDADDISSEFLSTVAMAASTEVWARERKGDFANLDEVLRNTHASAIIREAEDSPLALEGLIDPLSEKAQALSPLLLLLQDWFNPAIKIAMNPQRSLADVPLKSFYSYSQPRKDYFSDFGELRSEVSAVFSNLPETRTLTLNLKVPEPWLAEPTLAVYDLDNLVLEKIPEQNVVAVFELEALLITGHCYEGGSPPRGLQLILGTQQKAHMVDTTVMANLGYFQVKASPSRWILGLERGRSQELYTFDGAAGRTNVTVLVGDLKGKLVRLGLVKREGKEKESLLVQKAEEEGEGEGEDERFGKVVDGLLEAEGESARQGGTINIFSIASGHLYERFTKIMILSVVRNTRRPVKFWFIKNYLSPRFKDVIPVMAKHYGFEAQLVTYKWPSWLHKQTEKQRLIWAYKILFLDVLFPLSTEKVIFVDADQIVRADMGELYDMDLDGRPLAYTPMCDNNLEMEGYRFWKQGFWKDHLNGRPYHISALYVVDLVKFRRMAAGDQLRVVYESLSRDPNSLANLDQDLPNYAQHMVPIFSLPQHWLWCESWCGNTTKPAAKTIDLCNNPMTKEPKLIGARRIVSEWTSLDDEQREFTEKVERGEIGIGDDPLAANVDVELREEVEAQIDVREAREEAEGEKGGKDEL